ncbi:MAG: RnfABCDGE type electron transport complex subunit D [Lachnospiraceae bacterium]|nr:RnfABCDGE type electron transport complex subunit D [Lachnospiraceae bacterium]
MSDMYNVSASPHARSKVTTQRIMFDVALALVPAGAFGIYNFGLRALVVMLVCVGACVLTEFVYEKLMKKTVTIMDGSALVTGLLLAYNLPVSMPLWMAFLGSVFAILIVKMVFGGLGQNFMNPALGGRAFLVASFGSYMNNFEPVKKVATDVAGGATPWDAVDAVSSATPLAMLKNGETVDILDMFIGNINGTIGEVSALAILVGAAYLVIRKVISLRIPLTYILSFVVFMILFGGKGLDVNFLLAHVCGGGLMLGAFFMATDYVTSPITVGGQVIFGIFLGVLTGIFRVFGGSSEGVSYAILMGNLIVPLIEKITLPKAFGREGRKHEK